MVDEVMTNGPRQPDEYEARFMSDGGTIVHREKMSFPAWFRWLMGFAIMLGLSLGIWGSAVAGDLMPVLFQLALMPAMLFFMVLMSTLRVTVTDAQVTIQYGPWGPRIPLDRIEKCEAEDYQLWKYGGYGIRYSIVERAWCYNMIGDKGKAVRIEYRTDSGKLKRVLVASASHVALANAINQARGAGHLEGDGAGEVIFTEETGRASDAADVEIDVPVEAETKA